METVVIVLKIQQVALEVHHFLIVFVQFQDIILNQLVILVLVFILLFFHYFFQTFF